MRRLKVLLLYAASAHNATFSYQHGWPCHFQRHPRFDCTIVNLLDRRLASRLRATVTAHLWSGDAVVMLHSVFSNACYLSDALTHAIARLRLPIAFFMANEYKNMPEKLALCERLGVSLLVTQTAAPEVHGLYRERLTCPVIGLPNTGLDTDLFRPAAARHERPIDLGYRTDTHAFYLGHRERENMAEFFANRAAKYGLTVDISTRPADRLAADRWAAFLNRCKGQLGTEAGTDYFELSDDTRGRVNAFVHDNPDTSFEEVWQRFFRNYQDPVPMRIISGRNIEAAGTRTVQVLFEGKYDGYFEPDVHYIPLKKDFSNADEAVAKFKDVSFANALADNAYQLAVERLTYDRLIDRFGDALEPLV